MTYQHIHIKTVMPFLILEIVMRGNLMINLMTVEFVTAMIPHFYFVYPLFVGLNNELIEIPGKHDSIHSIFLVPHFVHVKN